MTDLRTFFSFEKRDLLSGWRVYTIETRNRRALNHKFVISGRRPPRPALATSASRRTYMAIYIPISALFRYHDFDAAQNCYIYNKLLYIYIYACMCVWDERSRALVVQHVPCIP